MFDFFYYRANQEKRPLAVLFIDIDFLKTITIFTGTRWEIKSSLALPQQLKTQFVMSILLRVMGGEEFVVLLPETPVQGAYSVAANIYKAIERQAIPHAASLVSKYVTISLGLPYIRVG